MLTKVLEFQSFLSIFPSFYNDQISPQLQKGYITCTFRLLLFDYGDVRHHAISSIRRLIEAGSLEGWKKWHPPRVLTQLPWGIGLENICMHLMFFIECSLPDVVLDIRLDGALASFSLEMH